MEFTQLLKFVGIFSVAFSFCYIATVPTIRTAFSVGAVDVPRDDRRMHTSATARCGGIAIFSAFTVAVLCYNRGKLSSLSGAILSGGAIIAALGFCDDVTPLPPRLKLLGELFVSIIPLAFGIYASEISVFGFSVPLPFFISLLLSSLWIVTVTNALNLIDGLDGLAAGVGFIASLTVFARLFFSSPPTDALVIPLALAGALLGFLPHNTKKAKIFMGDCGSLLLGYCLSVLTLVGNPSSTGAGGSFSVLPSFLILAYPLCDTLFAVFRRAKSKKGIFTADKKHIHHRLCARGYTKSKAAFILVFLSAVFCVLSLLFR